MFFGNKRRERHAIAIDCGTSSVRAALFTHNGTSTAQLAVTNILRMPFKIPAYMDSALLMRNTTEHIRNIIQQIPADFHPQEILLGLSSPFFISQTIRITHKRAEPNKPITAAEVNSLTKNAEETFKAETSKRIGNSKVVVLDTRMFKTYINGYCVPNAIGTAGKVLDTHLRMESTSEELFAQLQRDARAAFPKADIRFASLPIAYFYTMSAAFNADDGFIVIDIGGEVTDITLISNNVLEGSLAIPYGNNVFLREIAAYCNISLSDALYIARRYAEQKLETKSLQTISPVIAEMREGLFAQLIRVFGVFATHYSLPRNIVLTGGGSNLPLYKESFTPERTRSLALPKNSVVTVVTPDVLKKYFSGQQFRGPSDTGIISLSLLLARGVL